MNPPVKKGGRDARHSLIYRISRTLFLALSPARRGHVKRADLFAQRFEETVQRHAPLAISLTLNLSLVLLSTLAFRAGGGGQGGDSITLVIGDGFLSDSEQPAPPAGGGGGAQQALQSAVKAMSFAPEVKAQDLTGEAITSTNITPFTLPEAPQIERQASAAISEQIAKVMTSIGEGTGTGTGIGSGEGEGTGSGSGKGTGEGEGWGNTGAGQGSAGTGEGRGGGSGNGVGIGGMFIQGTKIGVIHDVSGSMGNRSDDIRKIIQNHKGLQARVQPIPDTCLFIDPKYTDKPGAYKANMFRSKDPEVYLKPFRYMVEQGVHSVYLVTDLVDGQGPDFMAKLEEMFRPKGIRFYVSSSVGEARVALLNLIKKSGGAYELRGRVIEDLDAEIAFQTKMEAAYAAYKSSRKLPQDHPDRAKAYWHIVAEIDGTPFQFLPNGELAVLDNPPTKVFHPNQPGHPNDRLTEIQRITQAARNGSARWELVKTESYSGHIRLTTADGTEHLFPQFEADCIDDAR